MMFVTRLVAKFLHGLTIFYHALGESSYKDFFNLPTIPLCDGAMNPGGRSRTCTLLFLNLNVRIMHFIHQINCFKGKSKLASRDNNTRIVLILATDANVS